MKQSINTIIYRFLWLTSFLPMRLLYIGSTIMYFISFYIVGYRRKVIEGNLNLVFPEKPSLEINSIMKAFYRQLCDTLVETIKSISISEKEIRKRFVVENIEILTPLYKQNKSVLLMAGHYGNWEWSGILNKMMQHQAHAVYKPLRSKQVDTLIKGIRERFGGIIVSNKAVVPMLYRKYKKGINTLTYILSDQSPKDGAYKHRDTFMGIDVPVFTGTEELAKKFDFAVVYLKVKKIKRGYYKATFEMITETPKVFQDFEITRIFLDKLEAQIKETPALYLWSHKRWKLRA